MELRLRYYGDPILRKTADPIVEINDEIRELAESMIDTMYSENGIGLAAPQVGISKRLIVALRMQDAEDVEVPAVALVNPRVITTSRETWSFEEGCLSIPGINAEVVRPVEVEVEYQDLDGETRRVHSDALFGRILLHEIDHLDGRLFVDYLSSAKKSLVRTQLKEIAKYRESA